MEKERFYGAFTVVLKRRVVKVIPIIKMPIKEFDTLELVLGENQEKTVTFEYNTVRYLPLVEVNRAFKKVLVRYYFAGTLVYEQEETLLNEASLFGEIDPFEATYEKALNRVQNAIDNINGTAAEKEDHNRQLTRSVVDPQAKRYVMTFIDKELAKCEFIPTVDKPKYAKQIWASIYGMGILQPLDDDPEVGEIMVNARPAKAGRKFHCEVYYIKNQTKFLYEKTFESERDLRAVCNRIIAFDNKTMNAVERNRIEATSPRGDRINLIIPDASDNYLLNIRKFANFVPDLNTMYTSGTVDEPIDKLLRVLVNGKANIGIGGPMGTGKTTMINFMLTYTPLMERKVIIASVSEMDVDRVLKGHDVAVLNVNEDKNTTFDSLLVSSLRTTADRVIIPESRGSEFKSIYEANLKTKGNMFTAHAIDAEGFLNVCVDMYMSSPDAGNESSEYIRNKLSRGIDIFVIMCKVGKKIRIRSISEIVSKADGTFDRLNDLYYWRYDPENPTEGKYAATGHRMTNALMERLNSAGVKMSEVKAANEALITAYQEGKRPPGGDK